MSISQKLLRVLALLVLAFWSSVSTLRSADCNGNGIDDAGDLVPQFFGFLETRIHDFGGGPRSLVAADLNGDGSTDLATDNEESDSISVLLNQGDGRFEAAEIYLVGGSPSSLIAADLNGDGMPDLATANRNSNDVSVLLNRGGGTFKDAITNPVLNEPLLLISADLNGDGKLDLATATYRQQSLFPFDGDISILLNEGAGTFKTAVSYARGGNPRSLIARDFNGDGKPDLATANYGSNDVSVLLNQGDGTFKAAVSYPLGTEEPTNGPGGLIAADLNGDGNLDLTTPNAGSNDVSVLINQGDGTFKAAVSYRVGTSPYSLIATDLDGDGRSDLATANPGSNDVSILLNLGDGTFKAAVSYPVETDSVLLIAADLDGDRKPDLAQANQNSNDVSVLLNLGDGTFKAAVSYTVGKVPFSLIAADVNGDGEIDLATANAGSNDVSVLLNEGDGTFKDGGSFSAVVLVRSEILIAADFNADGHPDLAGGGWRRVGGAAISVVMNMGDGTFTEVKNHPVEGSPGHGPWSLIAADLSGDGNPDLAMTYGGSCAHGACGGANYVYVLINTGDGTFRDAVHYPVGRGPQSLIAVDLNRDGKIDLVTESISYSEGGSGPNEVNVLLNLGDGTFKDAVSYGVAGSFSQITRDYNPITQITGRSSLIPADLNADGEIDLAMLADPSADGPGVSILFNQGDGRFRDAVTYRFSVGEIEISAGPLIAADLNGDGKPDFALAMDHGTFPQHFFVLLNHGDGTFQDAVSYLAGGSMALIAADLNGDGKPDLITSNGLVLLNNGDGTFQEWFERGQGSSVLFAADFDGDERLDLIAGTTLGNVTVLLGTGDGGFIETGLSYFAERERMTSLIAADFNGDGKPDLAAGLINGVDLLGYEVPGITVLLNQTSPPFSQDLNHNAVPDECETRFHRGDPNSSGTTDISDGIAIFGFLFLGSPATISCQESADSNNDGAIDISDGIYLLSWLFTGGPEPAVPGPSPRPCGYDADPTGTPGDLGCDEYLACN